MARAAKTPASGRARLGSSVAAFLLSFRTSLNSAHTAARRKCVHDRPQSCGSTQATGCRRHSPRVPRRRGDPRMRLNGLFVAVALAATPALSYAQTGDLTHEQPAAPNASVDFGVLPIAPLGPLPCLQAGGIGGPADPCAYKLHHLTPEEVTVEKGGQVTFQIHGGGHGFAIYEVSKDTTRDEL